MPDGTDSKATSAKDRNIPLLMTAFEWTSPLRAWLDLGADFAAQAGVN